MQYISPALTLESSFLSTCLVSDADEVVAEALSDLVSFAWDDRCHVNAYQHGLVCLDCYQSITLEFESRCNISDKLARKMDEVGMEGLTACFP